MAFNIPEWPTKVNALSWKHCTKTSKQKYSTCNRGYFYHMVKNKWCILFLDLWYVFECICKQILQTNCEKYSSVCFWRMLMGWDVSRLAWSILSWFLKQNYSLKEREGRKVHVHLTEQILSKSQNAGLQACAKRRTFLRGRNWSVSPLCWICKLVSNCQPGELLRAWELLQSC